MRIIERGHVYELDWQDDDGKEPPGARRLTFVNREKGTEHPGTQSQEVLRALIDRTYHCDDCLPHDLNGVIIYHLRMALALHEMRALGRKVLKGELEPELVHVGDDGHFVISEPDLLRPADSLAAPRRRMPTVNVNS